MKTTKKIWFFIGVSMLIILAIVPCITADTAATCPNFYCIDDGSSSQYAPAGWVYNVYSGQCSQSLKYCKATPEKGQSCTAYSYYEQL